MVMDKRTIEKLKVTSRHETLRDPKTGEIITRRKRARSFKRFYRDLDEVLAGSMSYESMFDLLQVISELDVQLTCTIGDGGRRSYMLRTMDGKFNYGNINLVRTLLEFVRRTVPIPGVFTERQIKRIKSIVRMNTVLKQVNDRWERTQKAITGDYDNEDEIE